MSDTHGYSSKIHRSPAGWLACAFAVLGIVISPVQLAAHELIFMPVGACVVERFNNMLEQYEAQDPITLATNESGGFEIEGYVPKRIGKNGLAELIADEMRAIDPKTVVTVRRVDLPTGRRGEVLTYWEVEQARKGGATFKWEVKDDVTIKNPRGTERAEINSPVLRSDLDRKIFYAVTEQIAKKGFKAEPMGSGTHFHVGMLEPTVAELTVLDDTMRRVQWDLQNKFNISRRREKYAMPNVIDPYEAARSAQMETAKQAVDMAAEKLNKELLQAFLSKLDDRYHILNLQGLRRRPAVEFRLPNSTTDINILQATEELFSKLVTAVRAKDPKLVELLVRTQGRELTLEELSTAIGFDYRKHQPAFLQIKHELNAAMPKGLGKVKLNLAEKSAAIVASGLLVGSSLTMLCILYRIYRHLASDKK